MYLLEDNQACLQIIKTGKNPTMRHITRTHGVNTRWLHGRAESKTILPVYCDTHEQAADIFTKAFSSVPTWEHVRALIQIVNPGESLASAIVPATSVITSSPCGGAGHSSDLSLETLLSRTPETSHGVSDYWLDFPEHNCSVRVHSVPRQIEYCPQLAVVNSRRRYQEAFSIKFETGRKNTWIGYTCFPYQHH